MNKVKYSVGVDLAKASFDFAILDSEGSKLQSNTCKNTRPAIKRFISRLIKLCEGAENVRVAMESTGRCGFLLWQELWKAGVLVSVMNPAQIKYFAASLNARSKNDAIDAWIIARFLHERQPRATPPASAQTRLLREICGELEHLIMQRVRIIQRAHEIGRSCPQIAASLQRQLVLVKSEIRQIVASATALIKADEQLERNARLLQSIPGIAKLTTIRVLAFLGEKQFETARQLAAFAGLSPRQNTSGTSLKGRTRLCKTGSAKLRKSLYMPALTLWRQCPAIRPWADGIARRTGSKKSAVGAVMRKLIHIIFGVLKNQTAFDPTRVSSPVSAP